MRKVIILTVLIIFLGFVPVFGATNTNSDSQASESYLQYYFGTLKSWFGSSTLNKPVETPSFDPKNGSEGIFGNINGWFRSVTGIGLDQILLALWRLLLWIIKAMFGLVWNLVLWILSFIR